MSQQIHSNELLSAVLLALALAFGAALIGASPAAARTTECGIVLHDPDMTPAPTPEYLANFELLFGGTYDNLVVPEGTWCFAFGVTVNGNVSVSGTGSKLNVGNNVFGAGEPSTIHGNAAVRRGAHMNVFASVIAGNYSCDGCLYFGSIANEIGGNVQAFRSETGVDIRESHIGAKLQLNRNAGPVNVFDNIVAGKLECTRNDPAATSSGNTAERYVGECGA